jgi:hypothetical protein
VGAILSQEREKTCTEMKEGRDTQMLAFWWTEQNVFLIALDRSI